MDGTLGRRVGFDRVTNRAGNSVGSKPKVTSGPLTRPKILYVTSVMFVCLTDRRLIKTGRPAID